MRTRYGIDAPALVLIFLMIGVSSLVLSIGAFWLSTPATRWLSVLLIIPAIYTLGMFCLMMHQSIFGKVRGRERILDLVAWRGDEAVLDIGCGRGLMVVGAAHRLTTGRAVGVDIWQQRDQSSNTATAPLQNARSEGVGDRVGVETADMRRLPFADHSFDIIVSNWAVHNLETIADRSLALAEMVRVVRDNGTILLTDIINRDEYLAEMRRLGAAEVRLFIASRWKDRIFGAVSFGAYQPATVVARGFAATWNRSSTDLRAS